MNITWKQIKAEIDGLPKTEKTLALKKMADDFEKELREKYAFAKSWSDVFPERADIVIRLIKEILGDCK